MKIQHYQEIKFPLISVLLLTLLLSNGVRKSVPIEWVYSKNVALLCFLEENIGKSKVILGLTMSFQHNIESKIHERKIG